MALINRTKIRKDVLKLIDRRQHEQNRVIYEYYKKNKEEKRYYQKLWKKILEINEKHLKRQLPKEKIYGVINYEEMLYMAKLFRYIEDTLANIYQKQSPIPKDITINKVKFRDFSAEWQIPLNHIGNRTLLYIHGGGFVLGSVHDHRLLTVELAQQLKMKVLSIDYRLAPEFQFPTHIEDCVNAYKWLLSENVNPTDIVIAGDSAGGNLTLTTLLKLKDQGITLPHGAICLSPVTDLSFTDNSFYLNAETDPILADKGIFWWTEAYMGNKDPYDPLLSPVFGDLKGLPPLLIQVSTCEMLYGDSERFTIAAKAAGLDVTFETWDDMLHVFQDFGLKDLPEAQQAIQNMKKFIQKLYNED